MPPRPKRKAVEATMAAAKRSRGETDLSWGLRWSEAGPELTAGVRPLLVLDSPTLPGSTKVAGFDIDWTIIKTASGRTFATGADDWEFWDPAVPPRLRGLHEDGYRVVFFTNQAGIEKGKVKPLEIRTKIENIIEKLNIPVYAYVCTGTNHMRKPNTAPWQHFEQNSNLGVSVDRKSSLFVGDAAGRAKNWAPGRRKDFSCGDRMFAANLGLRFQTPEEFFLGEDPAPFEWGSIDPNTMLQASSKSTGEKYHAESQEMVLMVAPPACGKSTFSRRFLVPHGYVWVNRDTLNTPAKCLKAAEAALKDKKSVVIDNTNPSKDARSPYIKLAQKIGVPIRCFQLQIPLNLAHHLNIYRMNQSNGRQRRVPDVGYAVYKKNFQEPEVVEGFTEVKCLPFVAAFDNKKDEELFKQWTV